MSTTPEARLTRRIASRLRAEGAFVFKVHGSDTMMAGLPDLVVCWRGRFLGLEVKRPGHASDVSPRQRRVHGLIAEAGGVAVVVTSIRESLDALLGVDTSPDDERHDADR